ncbi:Ltp family lipoprotein [Longirhabdus pacifica]|uniref:Ltp family lipoprotein n=1 Tax=Longirhabdus pacifica TaxID=2305227 RepID=UPI001F0C6428|nr:Ltp family lipoprotein [Longirhabdus pacifica]
MDNIEVDWNEQAVKPAEQYLQFSSFSRSGLITQLKFEGFTTEEATYGVDQTGLTDDNN